MLEHDGGPLPRSVNLAAVEHARDLVMRYGWNATAYQILNPGLDLWFSAAADAVIGYVTYAGIRVVAGAPVCSQVRLRAVTAEFEQQAAAHRQRVCYFCAESRLESLYREEARYSMMSLGAQPVWDPARLVAAIESKASLRAQLNRAANKGVTVGERPPQICGGAPELEACLQRWLAQKGLPPLHFLVEPQTLGRLADRRTFVATRAEHVAGFLVASPVPARNGWLIEQIVRHPDAPNGTAELMIDAAARVLAGDGSRYVTLGLAPLSRRGGVSSQPEPAWLRGTLGWIRAHGRRFYNFRGLEAFKAKFAPDRWDSVYAVTNQPSFSPRSLYSIAAAFGGGSPALLIARTGSKAIRAETSWLRAQIGC